MHLILDLVTKLLLVADKNIILVIYDRLSKIAYFVATTERTLVKELVRLFKNNVWKLHRLLERVISDRRPQFVAELIKELDTRNRNKVVKGFPPIDRWADRMNEPRVRIVLEVLYEILTEKLARVVSNREFSVKNKFIWQ